MAGMDNRAASLDCLLGEEVGVWVKGKHIRHQCRPCTCQIEIALNLNLNTGIKKIFNLPIGLQLSQNWAAFVDCLLEKEEVGAWVRRKHIRHQCRPFCHIGIALKFK
jgi:hypothetical protein